MVTRTPFGEWLRQRRHLLDLTQAELAAKSNCSTVSIRKLESGERKPSLELAQVLATVLRIPTREQAAFVQFARSDELEASFRLPAWEPDEPSWRSGQLPANEPEQISEPTGLTLHYDLVAPGAPKYTKAEDGRTLADVRGTGTITGDIEGSMDLHIAQVIRPKPSDLDYSQALPMQIGAIFTIHSGDDTLEGMYTGSATPILDANGNGTMRVRGTGQIIHVTIGFIDLFLNYVFVEDVVQMREGTGTGAKGIMQLKSAF